MVTKANKPKLNKKLRESFRVWLVEATNCDVQNGVDDKGWPCGTCTVYLFERLGLDPKQEAYNKRNDEADRHNEVWRAILQIRDAE